MTHLVFNLNPIFIEKFQPILLPPFNDISINRKASHLEWRAELFDTILNDYPSQLWFNLVLQFQRRRFKCDLLIGINRVKEKIHRITKNNC